MLSACGFRNDPQPPTNLIPAVEDLRARFRDDHILVSWKQPQSGSVRLQGAVQSYELIIRRVPLACADCRPELDRRLTLNANSPELLVEGQTVYFPWKPEGLPAQWIFQLQTHFQFGNGKVASSGVVEGLSSVPSQTFSSEPVPGSRQVRLYWKPRQERVVRVFTLGAGQYDRPVFYKANIYRRFPPAPWPLTPLNGAPLETAEYLIQPPASGSKGGPDQVEYTVRLVDQFGNEGPAAPPLRFSSSTVEPG